MTRRQIVSVLVPSSKKASIKLVVLLAGLFLVSCSHPSMINKNATAESKSRPETAQRHGEAEPRPGDTRVIDGVEYIYGKNVRYMVDPGEPEYLWVRRDQYSPDTFEASRARAAMAADEQKRPAEPGAGPEEELNTGRKWTSYGKDGDGIGYFYDKDAITRPSKDLVRVWRKREFPSGVRQKEIVTLDEIDCRGARYRSVNLRVTYRDGTTQAFDKATPWTKIYVDSAEEYLMGEYCK